MREKSSIAKTMVRELAGSRTRRLMLFTVVIVLFFSALKLYFVYQQASCFNEYVSDEVWYVSSARNIMNDVFGVRTNYVYNGYEGYTLFFEDNDARSACLEKILEERDIIILKTSYEKAIAMAIGLPLDKDPSGLCDNIVKIVPGYPMPDKKGIYKYYNLEHPPLGKYLIGSSMMLFSDEPLYWRIPGLVEAAVIVIIVGYIGWRLLGVVGAFLASLAATLDPLTTNMASVAMLDIHLAFFTSLALLGIVLNKRLLTVVSIMLSGLVKYSGFFFLPFAYVYLRKSGYTPRKTVIYLVAIGFITVLIINSPLIGYFGATDFLSEFIDALKWHTTSRPPGPSTSNPIEWVLGWNPFMLHLNPDIPAKVNPIFYAPGFVVGLLTFFLYLKRRKWGFFEEASLAYSFMLASFFTGYVLTMLLGNRTLYSFYMTQGSPIFYVLFPESLAVLAGHTRLLDEGILEIKILLRRIAGGRISAYQWPRELNFMNRLMKMGKREKLLLVMFLGISLFSLLLHIGYPYSIGLYSDAQWLASGRILEEDPGRLMGLQGLVSFAGIKYGFSMALFLFIDAVFIVLAGNEYLIYTRRCGIKYIAFLMGASLSLITYGAYDGTMISVFLFLLGLNLLMEGKDTVAGLIMGLGTGNPVLLITGLLLLSKKPRSLLLYVLGFLVTTIPLLLTMSPKLWVTSFLTVFTEAKNVSLALVLGDHAWMMLPILLISLLLSYNYIEKKKIVIEKKLLFYLILSFILMPGSPPQWILPILFVSAPIALKWVVEHYLSDLLNAGILVLWFINGYLCSMLCKYVPSGPLDIWGFTALLGYLRDILLIIILVRILMVARNERA